MKEYQKLAVILFGWAILSFAVYILLIMFEVIWGPVIYLSVAGVLVLTYIIRNKGFKTEKPAWDAPEKEKKRYLQNKYLLLFALPLILVAMIDILLLSFGLNLALLFTQNNS
ncbi:MAG: hypothetical protein A2Y17_08395 [Clostridiales bacterium GWF2_38_85]|nr:MAG: hypothetical protein A2Y17_08395 [Clostridiales bacterium GWF2_38_85]HBL83788.1 hypothetical protein [Clostridiales bacterium]